MKNQSIFHATVIPIYEKATFLALPLSTVCVYWDERV